MRKRILVALAGLLLVVAPFLFAATTLSTTVIFGTSGTFVNVTGLGTSPSQSFRGGLTITLTNGVGINQADMVFTDQRTLTASSVEDLDLDGGALIDAFGTTFTLVKLKVLMVCAAAANTNDVVLGGDVNEVPYLSTAATTITIKPGACFQLTDPSLAGITVTAATGDIIQVTNGGGGTSVTYDVIIVGTSA